MTEGSLREKSDRRGSLRGYLGGGQCGLPPEEVGGLCGGVWLYQDSDTAAEDELEVLSQAMQPVEVTAKAKHDRAGSLRAATLSSKGHFGILVEKHKLEVKGDGSDAATAAVIYIK